MGPQRSIRRSRAGVGASWRLPEDKSGYLGKPARRDPHSIAPNYVPEGEVLGRVSQAMFLEAARELGLR